MAAEGQAAVRDRLSWQHQVPALLDAYAHAVGEPTAVDGRAEAPAPAAVA